MMILKILLSPFSIAYGAIIFIRNLFFDVGIFKISKVNVPIVSVGNLTVGGTGKTPIVEFITRYLLEKGLRVAVISRGYKRNTKGTLVVSDGENILAQPEEAGDELYQIAQKFREAVIIADENRARAAELAVKKLNCNIIVLDDAFQHRKIFRDLNIAVIDITRIPNKEFMLPAGFRREPLKAIRRSDFIIFTRIENTTDIDGNLYNNVPKAYTTFEPFKIININTETDYDIHQLKGKKCYAFCGIGNPNSFEKLLNDAGITSVKIKHYPDHYKYKNSDLDFIKEDFKKSGAELILTTEKDFIRLIKFKDRWVDIPIYYVEIKLKFVSDEQTFLNKIDNLIK